MADWFETLFGFPESEAAVHQRLWVDEDALVDRVSGKRYRFGKLSTPTLAELRIQSEPVRRELAGTLRASQVVANVQELHRDPASRGATFQVASQFNLLEMLSPDYSPEDGVTIYGQDKTQGPACAIACGAATVYRNYFAPVSDQIGQTRSHQINCLSQIELLLQSEHRGLWQMRNGYCLPTAEGLANINQDLRQDPNLAATIKAKLQVGIQENAAVTFSNQAAETDGPQAVTQVFCSALPVAYSHLSKDLWQSFASLVLEAAYEATFHAACLNSAQTGNRTLFLTLLGGGAFGNDPECIHAAIRRCFRNFADVGLEIVIVSYGSADPAVDELVANCC